MTVILRPYQLEAVKDILEKKKILIADDMGLGKCAESIAAKTAIEKRNNYETKTLVTCPASVAEHWEDEIKIWYKKREDTKVTRVQTQTYDKDLDEAEKSDFVIVGFPTLSYLGNQPSKIQRLANLKCKYGIIDEAHNARNPTAIRSIAVKSIYDSMDYLAILSGTPIPNTVSDIYMLLSLLDKENFPINPENAKAVVSSFYNLFKRDPEFVRRVLNDRMLRRTVDDYLHAKFPELRQSDLEVKLEGEHKEAYVQIYDNDDIEPTIKLIQLVKASIDPNLVKSELLNKKLASKIGKIESSVYKRLDDLVEEVSDRNGKVLVFSNLKENVTDKLRKRYKKYGAVVIDSDVQSTKLDNGVSLREQIRKKFQYDKDCKVLISTTVMDEGVDLTAATDVVHLTLPYTPATFEQRNRRSQRIGEIQKDHVNVHIVKPVLDNLRPTIVEGIERLLEDKKRIIVYLQQQPFSLTKEDLDEIKNGKAEKSKHLTPLIANPVKSVISHFGQLKGQGHSKILAHYEKYPEEAQYIARLYASHWDGYYGGNTANLYARVINVLEEKEDLERKLDVASGPFSLSRKIKVPVVNLDLNPHMLKAGRVLEAEGNIVKGNKAVQGSFDKLPFEDNSFDLAVCSLALHMSRLKIKEKSKDVNERRLALRELNRVLRNNGYGIITLPHTIINEGDFNNFYKGLRQLGFEVLDFSGFYKGPENSRFNVYLAGVRKEREPSEEDLDDEQLSWKMDRQLGQKKKRTVQNKTKKKKTFQENEPIEPEFIGNFYQRKTGRKLEDSVREAIR